MPPKTDRLVTLFGGDEHWSGRVAYAAVTAAVSSPATSTSQPVQAGIAGGCWETSPGAYTRPLKPCADSPKPPRVTVDRADAARLEKLEVTELTSGASLKDPP